jgi:oligogalacturonide lyase
MISRFKPFLSTSLFVVLLAGGLSVSADDAAAPRDWIDPATGHRIIRLSPDGGGASLYFHQNMYTPKGDKFVFNAGRNIVAVDLTKLGTEPVQADVVVPDAFLISVAWKTPDAYYRKGGSLWATNVETKSAREVCKLPSGMRNVVVNAEETLVFSSGFAPEAAQKVAELKIPMIVTGDLIKRSGRGRLVPGGRSMAISVLDIKTGETKKIHWSTEWINHLQASPTDPNLILFCHEGNWQEVDRIWNIGADGAGLRLMHTRTIPNEIAGHEFMSHDGNWEWYDLQTPRSAKFWLAGVNVHTGERIRYPLARSVWSVHYNVSRDGKLFCGDGGGPHSVAATTPPPESRHIDPPANGQWIYAFTPRDVTPETVEVNGEKVKIGSLAVDKLADLSKHDYSYEPNATITPDAKWVIFRSNMHGQRHVYAVEMKRSMPH